MKVTVASKPAPRSNFNFLTSFVEDLIQRPIFIRRLILQNERYGDLIKHNRRGIIKGVLLISRRVMSEKTKGLF
jgi:hypothetical protein